jgi:hypothetical protein
MKCLTCSHPQRPAIDVALLEGNLTYEALSQTYGLSVSSLYRHKKHLVKNTRRARQRLLDSQQQISLLKLSAYLDQVDKAVQTAADEGNVNLVLKGAQIGSRIIRQIGQMEVPLELDTVYHLISSPQWAARASLLPNDPEIVAAIRQAVTSTALAPCPDVAEDAQEEEIPVDASLPTREDELDHETDRGTEPQDRREKSAKLPKNNSRRYENNSQNQKVTSCEKNCPKNPASTPAPPDPDSPDADYPSQAYRIPAFVTLRGERYFRPGIF